MTSARGSASFRFLSPGRRLKAYCGTLAYEKTSVLIAGSEVAILFIGPGVLGILYYGSLFRGGFPTAGLLAAAAPIAIDTKEQTAGVLGSLLAFFLKAGSLTFGSGLAFSPSSTPRIRVAR